MLALGIGAVLTRRNVAWPDFGALPRRAAGVTCPGKTDVLNLFASLALCHRKGQATPDQVEEIADRMLARLAVAEPQARVLATDRGIACALVDYDALHDSLASGHLAGAAVDDPVAKAGGVVVAASEPAVIQYEALDPNGLGNICKFS